MLYQYTKAQEKQVQVFDMKSQLLVELWVQLHYHTTKNFFKRVKGGICTVIELVEGSRLSERN